jgi:hypothetical protein
MKFGDLIRVFFLVQLGTAVFISKVMAASRVNIRAWYIIGSDSLVKKSDNGLKFSPSFQIFSCARELLRDPRFELGNGLA